MRKGTGQNGKSSPAREGGLDLQVEIAVEGLGRIDANDGRMMGEKKVQTIQVHKYCRVCASSAGDRFLLRGVKEMENV